jgi:hypothetical protein
MRMRVPRPKRFWLGLTAVLVALFIVGSARLAHRFTHRDFVVRNAGPRPIRVLALGATVQGFAPLWSLEESESQDAIPPGAQVRFQYDFDGATLCGLLVFAEGAAPGLLKNPADSGKCVPLPRSERRLCCWPLGETPVLEVPAASELEPVPEAFTPLLPTR